MKLKHVKDSLSRRLSSLLLGATLLAAGWRGLIPTMPSMRWPGVGGSGIGGNRSIQKQIARTKRNLFYSQHHLSEAERGKLAVHLVLALNGRRVSAGRRLA